ncbi:Ig-like domain-containing protein [Thalassomonas viridans]|uniref:Ig-like domain-containing protein n=1 Tax=Thalassomonas viridans TaxID=137584 RepID=A0AAF0C7I7_9GAMM|nr:Ig-like domain-containing protein [Thalassomonas viridans]WDE02894.1 Ig-like domain-containing protein [Thalassomonas viridans]
MTFKAIVAALSCSLFINSAANALPATEFAEPIMLNPHMAIVGDSSGFSEFIELNSTTYLTSLSISQYDTVIQPLEEPATLKALIDAYGRENITISIASPASKGQAKIIGNADFQFSSEIAGDDKVILCYSAFGSLLGNIIIDISVASNIENKPNQLPVVKDIAYESPYGQAITFDPSSNDYDPDGDKISVMLEPFQNHVTHGTLSQNGNLLTFTPYNDGFSGGQIIYYRARDSRGAISKEWRRAIIYVRQPSGMPLPVVNTDSARLSKGETVIIDPLANDIGVEGYNLNVAMWSQQKVFKVVNNKIKYTASEDFSGIVHLYYTLTDDNGKALKWSNGSIRYGLVYIAIHD